MKSVRSVYKIGHGPSSSHTVGPYNAALRFGQRHPDADHFRVTLYGSLAFTGAGHGTGKAILSGLPGAEIVVNTEEENLPHPNTMLFTAFKNGKEIESVRVFSVGGGSVRFEDEPDDEEREIYPEKNFGEILNACRREGKTLPDWILQREGEGFREYLSTVWLSGGNRQRVLHGGRRTGCAYRLNLEQIEYAAEIAMEHNLGLTCDPVGGLVQIPCIERNAVAAMRAISAVNLSRFLYETRKISFDVIVDTMYQTGKDMSDKYRETSHGGLAEMYHFLSQTDESRFWLQQTMNQMKAEAPDEGGEANEWINRISILQAMIDSLE